MHLSDGGSAAPPTLIIEPGRIEKNYWTDLWRYRELFLILAWRDVSVRYKQTVIGVAWAIIRPLLTMLVFTVVFGRLARLPTEGSAPYALMVLAGMLPWTLFSTALTEASSSLISNSNLIGKVYFPRLVIPGATLATALVDFLISLALMLAMLVYYRFMPGWQVVALPVFILLALLASLGPGLLIASLNVKYRDFRHVIPFVVMIGLYVSPVGFTSQIIPERWRLLYSLNPVVGVIDGFRWCIIGGPLELRSLAAGLLTTAAFLWLGVTHFRRTERAFADVI